MAKARIETGTDGTWIFCDPDEGARAPNLVLFVHGYAGDADETWQRFPNLMLQADQDFFERFDIASFGYDSGMLANREDLATLTGRLRTFLRAYGGQATNVFIIAHSLGGLLARRYLVDCHVRERYQVLFRQVKQVHFIGVPHLGAAPAKGFLAGLVKAFNPLAWDIRQDSPQLVETLRSLRGIVDAATQQGQPLPDLYNYVGSRDWVAPMSQVTDGRLEDTEVVETIAGDHLAIAKPVTTQNEAYILITRTIKDWVKAHPIETGIAAPAEPSVAGGGAAGTGEVTANRDIIAGMVANVINIYPPSSPGPAGGGGDAGRPLASRSFYGHPSADALRLALAAAFGPRPGSVVEVLAAQAGVDVGDVQVEQAANEVWRQVLKAAWDGDRLEALMGLVLKEDRIRAHHERLRGLWEALRQEMAAGDGDARPAGSAGLLASPPGEKDLAPATDQGALLTEAATLLEPLCPSEGDRRALFLRALGQSAALRRVEWGGSAFTFATNAVHHLWSFGDAEDGQPALRRLLIAAAGEVGEPKRSRLLALARDLWPGR